MTCQTCAVLMKRLQIIVRQPSGRPQCHVEGASRMAFSENEYVTLLHNAVSSTSMASSAERLPPMCPTPLSKCICNKRRFARIRSVSIVSIYCIYCSEGFLSESLRDGDLKWL